MSRENSGTKEKTMANSSIHQIVAASIAATMSRPEGRRGPFAIPNAADYIEGVSDAFNETCREAGGPFWWELRPVERLRFIRMYQAGQKSALAIDKASSE